MNQRSNRRNAAALCGLVIVFSGCSSVGRNVADLALAGTGGVIGYQISDHKVGGAAAGAALGYIASSAARGRIEQEITSAEQRGFDRALNQAVKQQYWLIQHQQRSRATPEPREARLEPVVIPETKINGVIRNAHVEYLRIEP